MLATRDQAREVRLEGWTKDKGGRRSGSSKIRAKKQSQQLSESPKADLGTSSRMVTYPLSFRSSAEFFVPEPARLASNGSKSRSRV